MNEPVLNFIREFRAWAREREQDAIGLVLPIPMARQLVFEVVSSPLERAVWPDILMSAKHDGDEEFCKRFNAVGMKIFGLPMGAA